MAEVAPEEAFFETDETSRVVSAVTHAHEAGQQRRLDHVEYKWIALGVVLLGTIMTILDSTIVNIAIPTLQAQFKVGTYNSIAWVVTGYLLAQGAVIPLTGWATDRWGTKRLYMTTVALFTLTSMACGLAQTLPELIVFRVLQGIGGGMLMPIGMTIILQAVGPRQMGKVMGIFGIPMLLAPAAGPVLGGWFVQSFTWRLIFYVNVPIGIAAFVSAGYLLLETKRQHKLRLDVIGMLTAVPAVVALMYALDRSTDLGWSSIVVIGLIVASVVLFAAFLVRQLTTDHPLLYLKLFKDSTFSWAMVLSLIIVTVMFGAMLLMPIFLQTVYGQNALTSGLMLLPQAAAAAIAMPIGGMLTDRIGPRPVVMSGLVLLGAGGLILGQLQPSSSPLFIWGALGLRGLAMGFTMMPAMAAALARVPKEQSSRASSITNTTQRVGSSLGIAVLVTVLAGQLSTSVAQTACNPSPQVLAQAGQLAGAAQPLAAPQFCSQLASRFVSTQSQQQGSKAISTGKPALDSFIKDYAGKALSGAFDRTFILTGILAFLGLIPASRLRRPEQHLERGMGIA